MEDEQTAQFASTEVHRASAPALDLANLLVEDLDPCPVKSAADAGGLKRLARDNVQLLFNEIWKMPVKRVEDAVVVDLPACNTRLPREKPVPKQRAPTKWELYAKEKGIHKRNKAKLVWDDPSQQWKPRWGYKKNKVEKDQNWLVEVPDHKEPNADVFAERAEAKRERRSKNELQRMHNVARSMAQPGDGGGVLPPVPTGVAFGEHRHSAQDLARSMHRAKAATASGGKFQPALRDEPAPRNRANKRMFAPNELSSKAERGNQLQILQRLNSARPAIDTERLVADARHTGDAGAPADSVDVGGNDGGGGAGGKRRKGGRPASKVSRQTFFNSVKRGKQKQPHDGRKGVKKTGGNKQKPSKKKGGKAKGKK